jgi:YVTN family beta-propeller protein
MKPSLLLMLALVIGAALLPRGAAAQPSVTVQYLTLTGIAAIGVDVDPDRNLVYVGGTNAVQRIGGPVFYICGACEVADIAVNAATNRIYLTGHNSNSVWVIDPAKQWVVAEVPVGLRPEGVGVNPDTNLIYVANWEGDTVSVIDGASNTMVATVPAGDWPYEVAVNPATNRIYVTNAAQNGTVSVIDGISNAVVATITVGLLPLGVAVNPATNRIYVANRDSNTVSVIDGATNAVVATLPMAGDVAVNPTTNRIYVTGFAGVSVIDGATNSLLYTLDAPGGNPAVNPVTSRVYTVGISAPLSWLCVIDDSSGLAPPAAASPTPPPAPTPTACPPAPAPPPADGVEWVALQCGTCNPNATTYPDNTPIGTIAGSVAPPGELESLWGFEGDTWRGWSPAFPQASDLTQVDRLDVVFICVGGSATFTRPVI